MKKFKNYLLIVCYGLIIFIITRPVPFSGLSTVANISLILIPFIYLFPLKNNETSKFYSIIFIFAWSLTLFFYSVIFCGNDLVLTFRFLIIIVLILIAYFIKLPIGILSLLFYFVAFQCIFLILFELVLMFNFIPFKPSDVRFILTKIDVTNMKTSSIPANVGYFLTVFSILTFSFGYWQEYSVNSVNPPRSIIQDTFVPIFYLLRNMLFLLYVANKI